MESKFVHLKLHTEYSLLEGVGKIDEYVKRAGELGINALAITDTSMFGAIEFFKKCKNAGIKPIIGLEIFLDGLEKVGEYSLTLLAKNQNGYKNLSKLSSLSYSRFTRKRNKIKYDELKKYSDDLYILSGGVNSEAVKGILDLENTQVRKVIEKLSKDFGDNFFIEVPAAGRLEKARRMLFDIVRKNQSENFVITNDIYYPNKEDAVLQKIVESIKEGSKIEGGKSENNEILYDDFVSLLEDRPIIPFDSINITPIDSDLTVVELDKFENATDFTVIIDEEVNRRTINIKKRKSTGRKINWERVNQSKKKTGIVGEEIVYNILSQEAKENGLKQPEHVSKTEGDGLGYDIRFWDKNGEEIHIEVKASKLKFSDGFEMSSNEVEASRDGYPYKIYFIYDLNVESKKCKLKIYDGPITDDSFKLVPSSYKIFLN